jgi:cytosine permease
MSSSAEPDYDGEPIPLGKRRGAVTMGLLWITMVTFFPAVLIGFQWYKDGITLDQVIAGTAMGSLIILIYSIPAAYLGAKSGQTYGMLSRQVFGRLGSYLVSFNLLWVFVACYSVWAIFLADGLTGVLHLHVPMAILAAGLAILMAFNNFFGFTGISNFARFAAAPLLIGVVFYCFFKVLPTCPSSVLSVTPTIPAYTSVISIAGFITGLAVWGNEADYWRYGKPNRWFAALPLALALCIGQIIFPVTGWMLARMSGITEFAAATALINDYAFGGCSWLAALVLLIVYCAANDSNMYGMINAVENVKRFPHNIVCGALALACAAVSAWLSGAGMTKSLESLASLNCVVLPTVSVVMIAEFFIIRRIITVETNFDVVAPLASLPGVRWPGFIALVAGLAVGLATAGLIPGLDALHVGLCAVQAWLTALVVYLPLRLWELKTNSASSDASSGSRVVLAIGPSEAAGGIELTDSPSPEACQK